MFTLSDINQCLRQMMGAWTECLTDARKIIQPIIDCQKLVPVVIPGNTVLLREIEIYHMMSGQRESVIKPCIKNDNPLEPCIKNDNPLVD